MPSHNLNYGLIVGYEWLFEYLRECGIQISELVINVSKDIFRKALMNPKNFIIVYSWDNKYQHLVFVILYLTYLVKKWPLQHDLFQIRNIDVIFLLYHKILVTFEQVTFILMNVAIYPTHLSILTFKIAAVLLKSNELSVRIKVSNFNIHDTTMYWFLNISRVFMK